MISVADGVGGWINKGVDVAKYSKQLMRLIAEAYDEYPDLTPKEILTKAHYNTTEIGSSTVVMAILDPNEEKLATTLLGDSSYMILRHAKNPLNGTNWQKLYRSDEQQHYFNCPYQIGTNNRNHPYDGVDELHSVKHNDIIIMATDGVWDNVFDNEIEGVISKIAGESGSLEDPQNASKEIADIAFEHSKDESFRSPFQVNSEVSDKETYYGGKMDDITVIVSQVKLE
mmetsp:Transcript_15991/g.13970  ORF Transcript_15991/g.13970 Transcript_15991/m.13970 type:complete len:228 (+) Transcript_15991:205-888(+)